jgi:cytochrome b561
MLRDASAIIRFGLEMASGYDKSPAGGAPSLALVRYDGLTILLHWVMAALIVANLLLALVFETLDEAARGQLIRAHKSIGVTILALAALRLLWRFVKRPPPPLASLSPATRLAAKTVHWILLWLPLVMALSGWAMISADKGFHPTRVFGLFVWPRMGFLVALPAEARAHAHALLGVTHLTLGLTLAALIVGHVAAALKHQFVELQPELERMTPGLRGRRDHAAPVPVAQD